MEAKQILTEGWATDVTTKSKTHYYKDGEALCGKHKLKRHMKILRVGAGNKYFKDCVCCIKKLEQINKP